MKLYSQRDRQTGKHARRHIETKGGRQNDKLTETRKQAPKEKESAHKDTHANDGMSERAHTHTHTHTHTPDR